MMIRTASLLLALFAVPLSAQTAPAVPPAPVQVVLTTSEGAITVEVDRAAAPVTSANFLRYVDARRLDGTSFYRAMKLGENAGQLIGLVQGGVRDPRLLYPPIRVEPTSTTGLRHVAGTISMARGAAVSARGDFFILASDMPSLDAQPAEPGDNLGFAAFGRVVAGMEVVQRILAAPTSPTLGEGVMRGQMLAPQVKISTARRVVN